MRDTCSTEAMASVERRQSMTTWGMLALAVFVSVGMAEWSKRMAAGETVIDPAVMEKAVKMAATDALRNLESKMQKAEMGNSVKVNANLNESGNGVANVATGTGVEK